METYIYTAVAALLAITIGPLVWGFMRGLNGFVREPDVAAAPVQEESTLEKIWAHDNYWWTGTGYMASDD